MSVARYLSRCHPRGRELNSVIPDIVYDFGVNHPQEFGDFRSNYFEAEEFAATFSSLDILGMPNYHERPIIPSFAQNLPDLFNNASHFSEFSANVADYKLIQDSHLIITAEYTDVSNNLTINAFSNGVCVGMNGDTESNIVVASFHGFSPFLEYDNFSKCYKPIDNKGNPLWNYFKDRNDKTDVFQLPKHRSCYPPNTRAVLKSISIQFGEWINQGNREVNVDFTDPSNIIGMCSGKDIISFKIPVKRKMFLKVYTTNDIKNLEIQNGKVFENIVASPFLLTDIVKDVHGRILSKDQVFKIYGGYKTQPLIGLSKNHVSHSWINHPAVVENFHQNLLAHKLAKLPGNSGSASLIEPGYQFAVHIKSNNPGTTKITNYATMISEFIFSKY